MSKFAKMGIVFALVAAVSIVLLLKKSETRTAPVETVPHAGAPAMTSPNAASLPRFLDLGSVSCIPCKMMAPIIEGLQKEYAGILRVEFIDVKENPDAGSLYGIRLIPTQIFFDASGTELFRHEGFFAKEDILAKWKELGVSLEPATAERK
jgi:thioredoxin 1